MRVHPYVMEMVAIPSLCYCDPVSCNVFVEFPFCLLLVLPKY